MTATNNTVSGTAGEALRAPAYDRVSVLVPARLHLGFLDLNGGLGRRYGGLGLTLEGIHTRLRLEPSEDLSGRGPSSERALDYIGRLVGALGLSGAVKVTVDEAIPEHVGLGSGTQMALAAGTGTARLYGLDVEPRDIARLLDRGGRSGIGIGSFEGGGVLLDGGHGADNETPPVLCRFDFPPSWRVLIIFDRRRQGKHGPEEEKAFRALPPFPAEMAAHFCRLVLMVALPALAETDIDGFGRAVAEIQRATGDYFAPVQGGRFASAAVAEVLSWLEGEGIRGVGQSSWGPTGFALIDGEAEADRLARAARARWPQADGLEFMVCRGRNRGGEIEAGAGVPADRLYQPV